MDGAYGVPGNPMVVLVKVHAPNAGGGIEYLSWGTAEWDGQSELQSLVVGTYGKYLIAGTGRHYNLSLLCAECANQFTLLSNFLIKFSSFCMSRQ